MLFMCCILITTIQTHNIYASTYACRIITTHNKNEWHSLLEKYTSHFTERVVCEKELETEQNCNILTPTLMAISVSFPFSWAAQPGAWGPTLLGAGFLYRILSPTGLVSKLTDFLSLSSYIIVQRPPSCGRHNRTHSTRPRSRLYSDIPWVDAPVIYIGAFPTLTARPGRRSIYNI